MNKFKISAISAACVIVFLCTGCGGGMNGTEGISTRDHASPEEVIELNALIIGDKPSEGMDKFYEQLDALTREELGCVVRFTYVPWGDERYRINLAVSSGEYDLVPGGVFSDYRDLALKNAFVDLNEYLYLVPDLKDHYMVDGVNTLEQCEIDGGLFGIPQFTGYGKVKFEGGFFYREDLRKKWGLDPIVDLQSMEEYMYMAKEQDEYESTITDNRMWMSLWDMMYTDQYSYISSFMENPWVAVLAGDPAEAVSVTETGEFYEVLEYMQKWYRDGLITPNILAVSDNEGTNGMSMMDLGEKPCETNATFPAISKYWINSLSEKHPTWEFGYFDYYLGRSYPYKQSLGNNTVVSILSKSKNIGTALRFLEKVHTDIRYYKLLAYGVEGIHYQLKDDKIVNLDGRGFSSMTGISDDMLEISRYYYDDRWGELENSLKSLAAALASEAEFYPLEGFTINNLTVEEIKNQLDQVFYKYFKPLICGVTEDLEADYQAALSKAKEAGLDDYITEIQQQIDDYLRKAE